MARYDRDGHRIDAPTRAEATADALALGDLITDPMSAEEAARVAEYTAAREAWVAGREAS